MPAPEIRGTLAPILQRTGAQFDPENGFTYIQEWRGLGENEAVALSDALSASGIKNEVEYGMGVATVRATNTTTNVTIDTWTIVQNELQKSSLENPLNQPNTISQDNLDTLAQFQIGNISYKSAKSTISATESPDPASALRLLDRLAKGSTDFAFSGYVLRHTTNVGNRYAANISDFNIDRIYTTSQLLSETQSSSLWVYPLPGRLAYKIQSLDAPPFRAFYQWGWLKRGSTETTAANNRVNITTEYWLDQWSTDEYQLAS